MLKANILAELDYERDKWRECQRNLNKIDALIQRLYSESSRIQQRMSECETKIMELEDELDA